MFSYHKSLYEFCDLELNEAKEYVTKLYDSKTINYHYADILLKSLKFMQETRTRHRIKRHFWITLISMFLGALTCRLIAG